MDYPKLKRRTLALFYTLWDVVDLLGSRFFFIFYSLTSSSKAAQKPLWLFCERGVDARDNGIALFEYVCKHHPKINAYYVISQTADNTMDYERAKKAGAVVTRQSWEHKKLFFKADIFVSAHFRGYIEPWRERVLKIFYPAYYKKKFAFIQHGIIKNDMRSLLSKDRTNFDLFTASAQQEYDYLKKSLSYTDSELSLTGMARYDLLPRTHTPARQILIMPTWRSYATKIDGGRAHDGNFNNFLESSFYKTYHGLITSQRLRTILERHDYHCIFYLHFEMERYVHCFTDNTCVEIATRKTHDIHKLLIESDVMITDYSSVSFDFAYMQKPLLYFQFDREEFYARHYRPGYFNHATMGFGPVCANEPMLLGSLETCLTNGALFSSKYTERAENFFAYRDTKNRERIFREILSL